MKKPLSTKVTGNLWAPLLKQAQIQLLVEKQEKTAVQDQVQFLGKAHGPFPAHAPLQVIHLFILLRCATKCYGFSFWA